MTGTAGSEAGSVDRASPFPVATRGSWCSYHREPLIHFPHAQRRLVPVHIRPVGRRALLVEVAGAGEARSLATWARAAGVEADEIVPAAGTVLFDGVHDVALLSDRLSGWSPTEPAPSGDLVELRVRYDGPDLAAVAAGWAMSVEAAVAAHAGVEYVADFCGFAPGFAYLAGLPETLAVPRLDTPRSRVPAGSVALAGAWSGVYPAASPGGWQILGTTDAVLWDPNRERPALLEPGTRVRFVPR